MAYNVIVTQRADELLEHILSYLIYWLKNEQAARHLLDEIERIYDCLEENPLQFPLSRDAYLSKREYREAVTGQMDYVIVFRVKGNDVNIAGIFHQLEHYPGKVKHII